MRKPTIRDLEGSVSVNGDVTPITRQPVEQVDSEQWPNMNLVDLWEQRRIMTNRVSFASSSGNYNIIMQLERGLKLLDTIISEKSVDVEDHLV